ncbi:MAG TPA: DUF2520 domain-containing protein [Alloacidobacterium sp.]|nr:DUF2520 domain-containing protein [Alloacidobacterium sp.]
MAVIGAGNWGTSLIAALRSADIPVREVVSRTLRRGLTTITSARLDAQVLWLCVPDRAIADAAAEIAARRRALGASLRGQIVVHSSGALTVAALEPARKAGATVASIHPVMSFPTRRLVALQDVLFGVETRQPDVKRRLYALIRKIGGKPFPIRSGKKAFYHAAGTLASPLLVSELSAAMATARLAGLSPREARKCVEVLALATARNVFGHGEGQSFSGPFARGDLATISLHLQALAKHPLLAEVYRALARYAVETLPVERWNELRAMLEPTE